jgi:hypothetical protein
MPGGKIIQRLLLPKSLSGIWLRVCIFLAVLIRAVM